MLESVVALSTLFWIGQDCGVIGPPGSSCWWDMCFFNFFLICVCFLSIYLIYSDFLDSTGYAGGFAGIPKFIRLYVG